MSSRIISQNYPPKRLWETQSMEKNISQQPKIYYFSPPEKSSQINSASSTIKSFLPSPWNSNKISSPYTSFICSCSNCYCIIFFNFRLYMYAHIMLSLINQCLLNVVFSITKELWSKISPKQNFYYPLLSMLFGNLCLSWCLFPPFHIPFFISNFIKL